MSNCTFECSIKGVNGDLISTADFSRMCEALLKHSLGTLYILLLLLYIAKAFSFGDEQACGQGIVDVLFGISKVYANKVF